MGFSFRQLRYFVATAEMGQVSQAALALSISQSAMTSAIKELEHTLGTTLFQRSSNGMHLTDAGIRFLRHAYDILAKIDDAMSIRTTHPEARGTLTVAATYTAIGYFLPAHLERLERQHPQLCLRIREVGREEIEDGLIAGRYEIAVLLTSNVTNPELISETLHSSTRRLWMAARHPLTELPAVSLARIALEPYIMLTVDEAASSSMRYWKQAAVEPRIQLRTSSVEAVRSMVANGHGVAILSDLVHRPWSLEGRRIETRLVSDPVPSMDVGLAWKRSTELNPAMTAFRDYFRQVFQATRADSR